MEAKTQARLLAVYNRERELLVARIAAIGSEDTFTARHIAVALAALDDAIIRLRVELYGIQRAAVGAAVNAASDGSFRELSVLEGKFGSTAAARSIASLSAVVPHQAIDLVDDLVKLETENLVIDFSGSTRAILQRGLIQGRSSRALVTDLARQVGDSMDAKRWQMERTLRTGLNAATARAQNASSREVREKYLPDLKRAGHEFLRRAEKSRMKGGGARHNHPFSFYLDGKVAELDQPWRITSPQFPVMFWAREGGEYVGMYYPAHLYEGGREVPYREGWDSSRSTSAVRQQIANEGQKRIEENLQMKADSGEKKWFFSKPDQPIKGKHFDDFFSDLKGSDTRKVLKGIQDAGLMDFLEKEPLKALALKRSMGVKNANGAYWPDLGYLWVKSARPKDTYKKPFDPGKVWSTSYAGKGRLDAMKRTLVHELGHHMHTVGQGTDTLIRQAFEHPNSSPITRSAKKNHHEYFAESWTSFIYHRDALKQHDPVGYNMVEEVLRLLGVKYGNQ